MTDVGQKAKADFAKQLNQI